MQKAEAGQFPASGSAISGRTLALLTGAVLLAHATLLHNSRLLFDTSAPLATRAFTTRTLQINAAPPTVSAPPAPEVAVLPARPPPRVRPMAETAALPPVAAPVAVAPPALQAAALPQPEMQRYDLAAPLAVQDPPHVPREAASAPTTQQAVAVVASPAPAPAAAPSAPLSKDASLPPRNYAVPGSVRLKFNATGMRSRLNYHAMGELLWLHDGKNYDARLEISALFVGTRINVSSGRITADGLAPNRYSDKFKGELAAHFDRDKGRITFSANTPDAELLPGAQDRLSVFVQLASLTAGEPAKYPVGTTVTFQTASQRAAEPWAFAVEGEERLNLPGVEQPSLKLVRAPRKEFDQKVELWLAPELGYMPARIRVTDANGDFIDLQLRSSGPP